MKLVIFTDTVKTITCNSKFDLITYKKCLLLLNLYYISNEGK